jgi:hypothetical protein
MPVDFPSGPSLNQLYSSGDRTWKWNGTGWQNVPGSLSTATNAINVTGGTVTATTGEFSGNVTMTGTGGLKVASGTTAERPTGANGYIRYNSSLGTLEAYVQSSWQVIGNSSLDYGSVTGAVTSTFDYGALS